MFNIVNLNHFLNIQEDTAMKQDKNRSIDTPLKNRLDWVTTIIPFVTHGGSGFSSTIRTIQGLEPDATVMEAGLSVSRNSVPNAQADVKSWTDSLLAD